MTPSGILVICALVAAPMDVGSPTKEHPAEATIASAASPSAAEAAPPAAEAVPPAPEAVPPADATKEPEPAVAKESKGEELPPLEAKQPPPPPQHIIGDLKSDFRHLFSWENGAILGGGGIFAMSVYEHDSEWTESLADSDALRRAANPGKVIGSLYFQVGLATSFYAFGHLAHKPRVAHIGWDLLRGQIVSQAITQSLKLSVNRERPDGDNFSFPSGHASTTFATASILHQ